MSQDSRNTRWQRAWDKHAGHYDKEMGFWDRHLFRDSRPWVCGRARGDVLEVAVGTGLNLGEYPPDVVLTGIDRSPAMLSIARKRAADLSLEVRLEEADAASLPFLDSTFDTVVCTYGLCAIPDHRTALVEMVRVLKPSGRLLLSDHVVATNPVGRGAQWLLELATVPLQGEHFRRRPAELLTGLPVRVDVRDRFGPVGMVERIAATKLTD